MKERTEKTLNGKEIFDLEKKEIVDIRKLFLVGLKNLTDGLFKHSLLF